MSINYKMFSLRKGRLKHGTTMNGAIQYVHAIQLVNLDGKILVDYNIYSV